MRIFGHHHHKHDSPMDGAPPWEIEQYHMGLAILERMDTMATKEQLDKLRVDVAALMDEAVKDITEAVKEAQDASPDPAIDTLDTSVTGTTQLLKDAAAKLRNPPV